MNYIKQEYIGAFKVYVILSFIMAAMPWITGPYLLNVVGIFLATYLILTLWIIARTVLLTAWKEISAKGK